MLVDQGNIYLREDGIGDSIFLELQEKKPRFSKRVHASVTGDEFGGEWFSNRTDITKLYTSLIFCVYTFYT